MTDIPEHIVERVARAIASCHEHAWVVEYEWPDYHQSAVAAIEALGGERVERYAIYRHHWFYLKDGPALLIKLDKE